MVGLGSRKGFLRRRAIGSLGLVGIGPVQSFITKYAFLIAVYV